MSEHSIRAVVALRDRASGRYLAVGGAWSDDPAEALLLDEPDALAVRRRFLCAAGAVELVPVECQAVA